MRGSGEGFKKNISTASGIEGDSVIKDQRAKVTGQKFAPDRESVPKGKPAPDEGLVSKEGSMPEGDAISGEGVVSDNETVSKEGALPGEGLAWERQLVELEEKNEEYHRRLLRLQADFDNYRKRMVREKEELNGYVTGEVILDFLDVLDNLERASVSARGQNCHKNDVSFKEGIDMIVNQFKAVLAKHDVKEIPAKGAKFDPNFHHAVIQTEAEGEEEGVVLEEIRKGYTIKSRVLRPSFVKVAL